MLFTFSRSGLPQIDLHALANRYQTGSDIFNSVYGYPAFVTVTNTAVHSPGYLGAVVLSDGNQSVRPQGRRQGFAFKGIKRLIVYKNFY
jgi:hypothetical protein